jgi:hypothetical protein
MTAGSVLPTPRHINIAVFLLWIAVLATVLLRRRESAPERVGSQEDQWPGPADWSRP